MKLTLLAAAFVLSTTPALAQVSTIESSRPAPAGKDPKAKVCETISETGTRLGNRRICMTVQEWQDQRLNHRNEVERAQQNTGLPVSN